MLAPEEIFIPTTSDIRDRTEMTPTEKRAVRLKERKSRKRTTNRLDHTANQVATNRKKSKSRVTNESKKTALKSIVRSGRGVTVVGNKLSALDGKKKDQLVNVTGGSLKL
jgi:U3 small nucleolar RNA-associated protein MPP10